MASSDRDSGSRDDAEYSVIPLEYSNAGDIDSTTLQPAAFEPSDDGDESLEGLSFGVASDTDGTFETVDEDSDGDGDSDNAEGEGEGGDEMDEDQEDGEDVGFDGNRAAAHEYLQVADGEHVDRPLEWPAGSVVAMLLFPLDNVVLFPSETLPLRFVRASDVLAVEEAVQAGHATLGIVHLGANGVARIGTTAEVRSLRRCDEDRSINVLTRGRQRFRVLRPQTFHYRGGVLGEVEILPDDVPAHMPVVVRPMRDGEHLAVRSARNAPGNAQRLRAGEGCAWPAWLYALYDEASLAMRAWRIARTVLLHQTIPDPSDARDLALWLAANLPLSDRDRQRCLEVDSTAERLRLEIDNMSSVAFLVCRTCGAQLASTHDIFDMSAEGPLGAYVNTHGYVHETVTVRRVSRRAVVPVGPADIRDTWFPGYAWTLAYCATCMQHLGWKYTAVTPDLRPSFFWGMRRAACSAS